MLGSKDIVEIEKFQRYDSIKLPWVTVSLFLKQLKPNQSERSKLVTFPPRPPVSSSFHSLSGAQTLPVEDWGLQVIGRLAEKQPGSVLDQALLRQELQDQDQ